MASGSNSVSDALREAVREVSWQVARARRGGVARRRLRCVPGRVRVAVGHCGCAAGEPDDADAYCDDCLPDAMIFQVEAADGAACYVGPICFRFHRLIREGAQRLAEYVWEGE